jgi:alpha/beta superfamily hydrolase
VGAHGIAGQKDMGLQPFAEAFAGAGLAVLLFDYRCFGGSDGEPRNWVSPFRHLQDWSAALDYVRVRAPALKRFLAQRSYLSHRHLPLLMSCPA